MARRYDVRGTRSFLIWGLVLLLVSLWFIWDGWFPRPGIVKDHPDPADHFYLFNKSVAVILLVLAAVCAYIHLVVR